jgi:prophage antirepressor-like protein
MESISNLPQVFNYAGKQVRTIIIDGEPWFVAKDVCDILDFANLSETIKRLDEDEVSSIEVIDSLGRNQDTNIVNEAGLYSLVLGSRKPEAKDFKRWITHEVIPQIRQTGAYSLNPYQLIATALIEANKILAERDAQIQQLIPKAEFFDAVAGSKTAISMGEAAKIIYEETHLGRNKLFKVLRQKGILMSDNIPYQEFIDRGYFRTIEQKYTVPDGSTRISIKTLVYQKGLDFIRKVIKEDNIIALKQA